MSARTEYTETLIFTKDQLGDARRAQALIRREGFKYADENELVDGLGRVSGVLSLLFMLGNEVTLSAGIISLIAGMSSNEVEVLEDVCKAGEDYLDDLYYYMKRHSQYDRVEVELPFLEFTDEDFRIVSGKGKMLRLHTGSGWDTL